MKIDNRILIPFALPFVFLAMFRAPRIEATIIALTETNAAQAAEIKQLRKALLRYGEHLPSCNLNDPCQCGFIAALEGTPK